MQNVNVSIEKAEATFELKPGKELQPDVLRKVVLDAGFTPRDIFITVRGKLLEKDGKLAFQPMGSAQVFSLVKNAELEKLKSEGLNEAGLVAKVVGAKGAYSLEIQKYQR